MADSEDTARLRGLYQDLSSLSDSSLANIERLCHELEATIHDFRKLLEKPPKNNTSRQKVLSGKISIDSTEFSINNDFQQGSLELADALGIDELEAAVYFVAAQEDAEQLDRSPLITAITRFHERREFLLECLRLVLRESFEIEREGTQGLMQEAVAQILDTKDGPLRNGSLFARKCLDSMVDIEKWLSLLGEQVQKASVVGQADDPDVLEAIEFQCSSLGRQHESLGAILCYLFKGNFTSSEDLRYLLEKLRKLDKFDLLMVHYVPSILAAIAQYGSPEGSGSLRDARSLHQAIISSKDTQAWALPNFHSAVITFWLAVYSGWYFDTGPSSPLQGIDVDKESEERTTTFISALDDGALEFVLAICAGISNDEWHDPARGELVSLILKESTALALEPRATSKYFQPLLMEHFDMFTESCIANMPDAVRMLKSEEDLQRLDQITALREGLATSVNRGMVEARTHLESFLMIMAFAFEHRNEAAQEFWADPDGNLYGFLQWASKRQTVPRVGAFCEMLCAISEGEENAASAHRFLLDEDRVSSKARRSSSMNWTQMFAELQLYATKVTEKPSASTPSQSSLLRNRKFEPADMNEPESPVMLTCYLRLISHVCKQSRVIREWMLQQAHINIVSTLLTLCSGSIPTYLRASAFYSLQALMVDRSSTHGNEMWLSIDQWTSGTTLNAPGFAKLPHLSSPSARHEQHAFRKIADSFNQTNAFVALLSTLVSPSSDLEGLHLSLAFPESLGATYRMPGIEPYIDFVLGTALARKAPELQETQARFLRWNCLGFAVTCLESFNENLVTISSQPEIPLESVLRTSSLITYIRLHPFSRIMEWFFNEEVLRAVFAASHEDIAEVNKAGSESILVLGLLRSIEVMNSIMDLQSTYLDIVRPLLKNQTGINSTNVANSSLASFEDSVLSNLNLITDLCLYCGTGHEQLTLVSMNLLRKLSSSRKLNKIPANTFMHRRAPNKMIEVLNTNNTSDLVSRSLASQMRADVRELECGQNSSGYLIKNGLLDLLNSCLDAVNDRPSVAHLLLGFSCIGNTLDVAPDSLFATGLSLLHAIADFLQTYPDGLEGSFISWMIHLKRLSFQVFKQLLASKISSSIVLSELQSRRFLSHLLASHPLISPDVLWDGVPITSPEFWLADSAVSLSEFVFYRSFLFSYAVTEIRATANQGSPSQKSHVLSALLGTSTFDDGKTISHPTVFDLFDFADLDVAPRFNPPTLELLKDIDVHLCAKPQGDESLILYDLAAVDELVLLTKGQLFRGDQPRPQDEELFVVEANNLMNFLFCTNRSRQFSFNRRLAIRSWAELVTTMVLLCDMESARRTMFILHAIQVILPKLEAYIVEEMDEAIELARLAETLLDKLDFNSTAEGAGRGGDLINEKLYHLFQVCVRGIPLASGNVDLRETLYNICSQYLSRVTGSTSADTSFRRHSQQTVRVAGSTLVEVICDDAYSGQETCRVSALLLLNLLSILERQENSILLVDAISQSNYLAMFVDVVRTMPTEIRNTQASDTPLLLSCYEAQLSLLQQLSQTKAGATHVLNAGLFHAVRESQLFAADPDIGIDIDNPDALRNYYGLLLSVMRIITSAVVVRGLHNEQMVEQVRLFLSENKQSMVGIFKRQAKIGVAAAETNEHVNGLVKLYSSLIAAVGFLEFEEQQSQRKTAPKVFS
ncbi:hypothetical protein FQN54_006934 [Arachnomyces sp. PD_36]|nr:hypothetical protein FQN54_006934 [Arachnomyces sp. PD_36]